MNNLENELSLLNNKKEIYAIIAPLGALCQWVGIWVTQRDGGIRVSLHYYNNTKDIDKLLQSMHQVKS